MEKGGASVSIVRVGLAETKDFAVGYDAIFGKKKKAQPKRQAVAKRSQTKKKTGKKK
jgi:hypothetical protein